MKFINMKDDRETILDLDTIRFTQKHCYEKNEPPLHVIWINNQSLVLGYDKRDLRDKDYKIIKNHLTAFYVEESK